MAHDIVQIFCFCFKFFFFKYTFQFFSFSFSSILLFPLVLCYSYESCECLVTIVSSWNKMWVTGKRESFDGNIQRSFCDWCVRAAGVCMCACTWVSGDALQQLHSYFREQRKTGAACMYLFSLFTDGKTSVYRWRTHSHINAVPCCIGS